MANIYEVARLAGVSTTTVFHVLNGTCHVDGDTEARVLSVTTERLDSQSSSVARAIVRHETKTIAVKYNPEGNAFYSTASISATSRPRLRWP